MKINRFFLGICLLAALFTCACPAPPHHQDQAVNHAALQQAIEHCKQQNLDDAALENCKIQATHKVVLQALIDDCKTQPCSDKKLATLESQLGLSYLSSKDAVSAEKHLRAALAYTKSVLGTDDTRTATSIDNLAFALTELGRVDESISLHQEACSIFEKQSGPESKDLGICLTGLGTAFAKKGDGQSAFMMYKKAFRIFSPRFNDSQDMNVLLSLMNGLEAKSDRLQVSLPDKRWFLVVSEFPELEIMMNNTTKPRDERFVLGTHGPSGVAVSVRMKEMAVMSARACRESYAGPITSAQQEQGIRASDNESFSEMEYETESEHVEHGAKRTENHHDIARFFFHDGTCIVVHVSKWNYRPADKPLFDKIFDSVTIFTLDK